MIDQESVYMGVSNGVVRARGACARILSGCLVHRHNIWMMMRMTDPNALHGARAPRVSHGSGAWGPHPGTRGARKDQGTLDQGRKRKVMDCCCAEIARLGIPPTENLMCSTCLTNLNDQKAAEGNIKFRIQPHGCEGLTIKLLTMRNVAAIS